MRPGLRVFCIGVSRRLVARDAVVVDRVEDADVALLRLQAPYEPRPGAVEAYFHAGSLAFQPDELARIFAVTDTVPSIVDIYLDRAAVLTDVAARAATLLVTFGVEDEPLLDVLTGRHAPAAGCRSTCRDRWARSGRDGPTYRSTIRTHSSATATA
jgi:beta-glucosidase